MQITLNGEARALPVGCTVTQLLAELDLLGRRLAVEINEEIVPRGEHAQRVLQAGDRVEIVQAIGGG